MKYPIYVHPAFIIGEPLLATSMETLLKAIDKGIEMSPTGEIVVSTKKSLYEEQSPVKVAG